MQYHVRALRSKEMITLNIEAASESLAYSQAQSQGYVVISAKASRGALLEGLLGPGKFPLVLFSQELMALIQAGLNLVEALEALAEKEQRPESREVLAGVLRLLNEGLPISTAMERYEHAFSSLYIATLRASEKSGGLEESLSRFIAYQGQVEQLRKKLVTASIYPVLLMVVGGLVIFFLMGYVVPKFAHIYEDMGSNLPFMSRILMHWGAFMEARGGLLLGLLACVIGAVIVVLPKPSVRRKIVNWLWRIPALGERFRIYQLARFYRTLGMLLNGGMTITSSMNMVSGLLPHSLRLNMQDASKLIRQGQPISVAMEKNGLTTPVALRMLRVGERSGRMGEMMERIAVFYDEETARWIDWFTRLFEPLLMLVIGLVIGLVVLMLYMPIFELAGSIQ